MKKKYLTYAGIISAIILVALFVMVFFISSPIAFLLPVFTIDPLNDQDLDTNNFLIMSGRTNLPEKTVIVPSVYPASVSGISEGPDDNPLLRGSAWISRGSDQWNSWNGTVDISSLHPADYLIVFKSITFEENYTRSHESGPLASVLLQLGNDSCTGDCIRKKGKNDSPFIRINPGSGESENRAITGITSLAPGTSLQWIVENTDGVMMTTPGKIRGDTTVTPGIDGIHRWSVLLPSGLAAGSYRIAVTAGTGETGGSTRHGAISDSRIFTFAKDLVPSEANEKKKIPQGKTPPYLSIDALPDMKINEKYVVSGTSNLPSGEVLLFQVSKPGAMTDYSFSFNPRDKSQSGNISGVVGCIPVENGSGIENLWTFDFDTYFQKPGEYEVNISNAGFYPGTLEMTSPTASCSRTFTLHGGSS